MNRAKYLLNTFLAISWMIPSSAISQPTITGDLTGNIGPGEFIVEGECNIPSGETLTIEPGTIFLFSGHYTIKVYGQINAEGTESDSIKFVRQYPTEGCKHGGIRFAGGASDNSSFSYCLIDNAKNLEFPDYYGGAIYSGGIPVQLSNSRISNCESSKGGGLYAINTTVTLANCLLK